MPRMGYAWTGATGRLTLIALVLWIMLVAGSLGWSEMHQREFIVALAGAEARASFNKDLVYRRWVALQGGVYVPPTDQTPPNPHLVDHPDRNVNTTSGKHLTLINPAYMTRQVHGMAGEQYGTRGHLTSLRPLRPENAADAWETAALHAFETGVKETSSVETISGVPFLRFMRPLFVEPSCLKCHASQGYREGDVRGGISVSVPLAPYAQAVSAQRVPHIFGHLVIGAAGLMGIWIGNRAQRRSESVLRESEARLRRLSEAAFEGLMLHERGVIVDANLAFARLFGFETPDGLIGKPCLDVLPLTPESKALVQERLRVSSDEIFEVTAVLPDGTHRRLETQGRDAVHGGRTGRMVAVRDITEQRRMEASLAHSETELSAIYDHNPTMQCLVDERMRVLRANRAVAEFSGRAPEQLASLSLGEILDCPRGSDDPRGCGFGPACNTCSLRLVVNEILAGGAAVRRLDVRPPIVRTTIGTEIVLLVSCSRLDVSGRSCALLSLEDVTAQKHLEAHFVQAQKMESVGRLAGGIAHDFNNMLGVILGRAELALKKIAPADPLRVDLEEILKAAHRSTDLTGQLLAFARRQTVAPQVLDLNAAVAGTLTMLRRVIGEDITLAWLPGASVGPVRIDPTQLDQMLLNLSGNARDAIAGVGTITIETANVTLDEAYCAAHPDCSPGAYVMLAVSDDGCGMDHDVLAHAFEPFFTTKGVGRGTGLGLATVYGVVKQNEGAIDVSSEPGAGTTFKVYLRRFEGPTLEIRAERTAEAPRARGETVLIVEDETTILDMGVEMLQSLGYTVLAAGTPNEAIQLAGRADRTDGHLHLLITDVVMPEMNGRELAARILALRPDLKCLFMSGYTADVIAHRGILEDGVHFLQKPFSVTELAMKVRAVLDTAPRS